MKKVISLEQLPPVVTLTRMKLGSQGIRPAKHSIDGNADCHGRKRPRNDSGMGVGPAAIVLPCHSEERRDEESVSWLLPEEKLSAMPTDEV